MNNFIRYFDLNARLKAAAPAGVAKTIGGKKAKAWPQWIALLVGVFFQPWFAEFRKTGYWNFTGGWGWLLFATIVAVVIFPSVYRASFNDEKPWLVHLAPIFTAGLGWEALFGAAVKAGAKLTGQ